MYIRKKLVKGREYYYLVEGKLIKGRVEQKVIMYIGDEDKLKKFKDKLKKLYEDIEKKIA